MKILYPATLEREAHQLALFKLPRMSGQFRCSGCTRESFQIFIVKIGKDTTVSALCQACSTLHVLSADEGALTKEMEVKPASGEVPNE